MHIIWQSYEEEDTYQAQNHTQCTQRGDLLQEEILESQSPSTFTKSPHTEYF